jgi:hypothetical protein
LFRDLDRDLREKKKEEKEKRQKKRKKSKRKRKKLLLPLHRTLGFSVNPPLPEASIWAFSGPACAFPEGREFKKTHKSKKRKRKKKRKKPPPYTSVCHSVFALLMDSTTLDSL